MRSDFSFALAASLTALSLAGTASAFAPTVSSQAVVMKATGAPAVGIRVLRPTVAKVTDKAAFTALGAKASWKMQRDALSGAVRLISGGQLTQSVVKSAKPADFVDLALAFVAQHEKLLGVSAKDLEVNQDALHVDSDVQFVKFKVLRDGLVVEDAGLDFRFKQGKLLQVVAQSFGEATSDLRGAKGGLERVASAAVLADSVTARGEAYRVVAGPKGYDLVRVARFDAVTENDAFGVQVEAATGQVFELRPTKLHLSGSASGQVHDRWYAEPLQIFPYGDTNLVFEGGSVTTDLSGDYVSAPDGAQPKIDGFEGPRVKVVPETGDKVVAGGVQVRDRWNVVYTKTDATPASEDKNVAQSMIFFHTNKIIQRAKGIIPSVTWLDQQLVANANLSSTCNAHWDGTTVNFYSAGADCGNTGLISDVMYHEWGHGLDANTGGIADGGYSEGFGDIMSLIMTRSAILGIGFRLDGSPVRELETDKIYPQDAGGGVHSEGLIIGSTFWDLHQALADVYGADVANEMTAQFALKTVLTASRYTDVYDALLVVDDDNADLSDNTPNYCTVNKVFGAHGLAVIDEACNLASIPSIEVDDDAGGNGNGILEPGERAILRMLAQNAATEAVTGLTGVLTVAGGEGLNVTDGNLGWSSVPAQGTAVSNNPARVTVADDVACGATFDAKVSLAAGARTAVVHQTLSIGRLAGTAALFQAGGLPLPIADNATTTATVDVSGGQWDSATTVYAARLKVDLTHTYIGDLSIKLVGPDGTLKDVWQGSGSGDDLQLDLDVSALISGLKGQGTWQIQVIDEASQDVGTLTAAELTLTPAHFECQ